MVALLVGHFEAASPLIAFGASLDTPNSRGITAAGLLREVSTPQLLKDAVSGQLALSAEVEPPTFEI